MRERKKVKIKKNSPPGNALPENTNKRTKAQKERKERKEKTPKGRHYRKPKQRNRTMVKISTPGKYPPRENKNRAGIHQKQEKTYTEGPCWAYGGSPLLARAMMYHGIRSPPPYG